ncbi:hypothetical protein Tco_0957828, partial [Tanacetum coccineum]
MSTLKFADTHNMVAFLSKPAKSEGFEQILQALVDGKKVIITESTVRRDLHLEDDEGVDCLPNAIIFEQLTLMGSKTTAWNKFISTMASAIIYLATNQKFNFSKYIFDSMIPQSSGLTDNVTYETVNEEMDDSLKRDATIATSLKAEQDSGNIDKTQSKATLNKLSSIGTSSGSGPRRQDTMGGIPLLKLGEEDASKQGRIDDIDANEDIYLVNVHRDKDMFGVNDLEGDEVIVETKVDHEVVVEIFETEVAFKDVNLSVD